MCKEDEDEDAALECTEREALTLFVGTKDPREIRKVGDETLETI